MNYQPIIDWLRARATELTLQGDQLVAGALAEAASEIEVLCAMQSDAAARDVKVPTAAEERIRISNEVSRLPGVEVTKGSTVISRERTLAIIEGGVA